MLTILAWILGSLVGFFFIVWISMAFTLFIIRIAGRLSKNNM